MNSFRKSFCLNGLMLVLLVLAFMGCGGSVDLRFKPAVGDKRAITIANNMSINMNVMGKDVNQSNTTSQKLTWLVESVDPSGLASVNVTLDQMDLGMMPGMDSMMAGAPGFDLKSLTPTGKSFSMKVSPNGRVESVTGMGPVVDEIAKKTKELVSKQFEKMQIPPQAQAMMGNIGSMVESQVRRSMGDSAMGENMEDLLTMYPDQPVKKSATWTRGVVRSFGQMPMVRSETWTLEDRKNGVATLKYDATVTPNNDAGSMNMGPMTMKMTFSGKITGTVDVDEATGWLVKGNFSHDLEGDMQMSMSGMNMPGGNSMKMKMTGTMNIESAKV